MATIRQLQQVYRFPGFVPEKNVCGLFGDHMAVVIRLRRRSWYGRGLIEQRLDRLP